MWGRTRPPFGHLTALDRVRLRSVALRYAARGWPVTPGAALARHRFVCGRAGCRTTGCHPAMENWEEAATADPARVATWWRVRPHAVLLATGHAFDVLEVPAPLGQHLLDAARPGSGATRPRRDPVRGPVAAVPGGRWMFLVRPGEPLRPELDQSRYVVCHSIGSWIPAPPTRLPEGVVRWVISPEECRWLLPDPHQVQARVLDAGYALALALATSAPPAQLPIPRRGGH